MGMVGGLLAMRALSTRNDAEKAAAPGTPGAKGL